MARATKGLNLSFDLIFINLNTQMWLVATVLDSVALVQREAQPVQEAPASIPLQGGAFLCLLAPSVAVTTLTDRGTQEMSSQGPH